MWTGRLTVSSDTTISILEQIKRALSDSPLPTPVRIPSIGGPRRSSRGSISLPPPDPSEQSRLLLQAIRSGNLGEINDILRRGQANPNIVADKEGRYPLHLAARAGDVQLVATLLQYGADNAARDNQGYSALHHATIKNHKYVAQLLLEGTLEGPASDATPLPCADPNLHDKHGRTALWLAAWYRDSHETLLYLASRGDGVVNHRCADPDRPTALFAAAASPGGDSAATLAALLAAGADPAVVDAAGATVLHRADWPHVSPAAARLLLGADADPHARDAAGRTPLHRAAAAGQAGVALVLLSADAAANAVDGDGWTALMLAAAGGALGLVHALAAKGADTAARNGRGEDAFHIACAAGHVNIVTYLLRGRDMDVRSAEGVSPLKAARKAGRMDVVKFLTDMGAEDGMVHGALAGRLVTGDDEKLIAAVKLDEL
jgi:uncharacterized protein